MDLHFEICCQILEGESPHEDALWNYSYFEMFLFHSVFLPSYL